uniref:Uncharacterized protein n=1 Tax=Anguilla anguilla TaxID=7936 RepID=A0A0E9VAW7_ANGAN
MIRPLSQSQWGYTQSQRCAANQLK